MNELKKANKEIRHASLVIDEFNGRFFVRHENEKKVEDSRFQGHGTIKEALEEAWDVM